MYEISRIEKSRDRKQTLAVARGWRVGRLGRDYMVSKGFYFGVMDMHWI